MLANQVCSLIEHGRIKTTLAKAKAVRPLAEKMVTLGKDASLHSRRLAAARLGKAAAVKKLFEEIAPRSTDRQGGYTRIIKLGARTSDSAPMAYIEWVDILVEEAPVEEASTKKAAEKADKKPAKKTASKKAETEKGKEEETKPVAKEKAKTKEEVVEEESAE